MRYLTYGSLISFSGYRLSFSSKRVINLYVSEFYSNNFSFRWQNSMTVVGRHVGAPSLHWYPLQMWKSWDKSFTRYYLFFLFSNRAWPNWTFLGRIIFLLLLTDRSSCLLRRLAYIIFFRTEWSALVPGIFKTSREAKLISRSN